MNQHSLKGSQDLVIRNRLCSIDHWLLSNVTIISQGLRHAYGDFARLIPNETVYCAGLFGLPPYFGFAQQISKHTKKLLGQKLGYYNEQGLVVVSIVDEKTIVIPLSDIDIVKQFKRPCATGLHFTGANRTTWHESWERYKCCALI